MADVRKITIEYDLEGGQIKAEYPSDPVLALGMLECTKVLIASKLDRNAEHADPSRILGVDAFPGQPPIGRA